MTFLGKKTKICRMTFVSVFDAIPDCLKAGRLGLLQVGPDQPEVVRAKLLPGDCAFCCALDSKAVFRAGNSVCVAVLPLANLGNTLDADTLCQRCCCQACR